MKTSVVVAIVIGVAVLAILVGGAAGFFVARSQVSSANIAWRTGLGDRAQNFIGPDMMTRNWRGRMGSGMMGNWGWDDENDSPRMQYMLDAYAEALDMTSDEVKTELNSGKSMWDLASAKGITAENYGQFMIDAATKALNKMVADEEITQKQADAMIENMQQNWQNVDPETCPCVEGFGGRGRMWRWYTP